MLFPPEVRKTHRLVLPLLGRTVHSCAVCSITVVSRSLWAQVLQPAKLLCLWDSPGKDTGVGCQALLQGIFPTEGLNPGFPHHSQALHHQNHQGSQPTQPTLEVSDFFIVGLLESGILVCQCLCRSFVSNLLYSSQNSLVKGDSCQLRNSQIHTLFLLHTGQLLTSMTPNFFVFIFFSWHSFNLLLSNDKPSHC